MTPRHNTQAHKPADSAHSSVSELLDEEMCVRLGLIKKRKAQMPRRFKVTYQKAVDGKCSPRMAIKAFCNECIGWEQGEAKRCAAYACPLWAYRPHQESGNA